MSCLHEERIGPVTEPPQSRLAEIERSCAALSARYDPAELDAETLLSDCRYLLGLLRAYGRHAEGCSAEHDELRRCRCGWREVAT